MFGELIGYGDYGFVFEDETEINGPDGAVIKIMTLDTPGWECNTQQYNMFTQLMNHQDQGIRTPGLPYIFKHFRGQMDINLLNILSYVSKDTDPHAVRALRESIPVGSEYAVVMMEKLPCVATNQYCGRDLKDKGNIAEEQSVYEHMVKYLYESGWWVRDVIDPRNVGYNLHGAPVWFDPMVARRQGFPGYSADAIDQCHEEVAAYPSSYRKAVQDGSYFKQRHGYGLFHSEENTVDITKAKNYNQRPLGYGDSSRDNEWVGETTNFIPDRVIVVNSLEELLGAQKEGPNDYYINFDLIVYRGSSVEGRNKGNWTWKRWLDKKNMGTVRAMWSHNVQPATLVFQEALMYARLFSAYDQTDNFELYSMDIKDYIVALPRPSSSINHLNCNPVTVKRIGTHWDYDEVIKCDQSSHMKLINADLKGLRTSGASASPVIFIYGGVNYEDMTVVWDDSISELVDDFQGEDLYSRLLGRSHWTPQVERVELLDPKHYKNWPFIHDFPMAINFGDHNFPPVLSEDEPDALIDYTEVHRTAESYVSQDYPQCYLCGLPAKIEVGTALGMRNFCGNKCRGEYEGVDYGPDDYYISPKLEHQLSIVEYSPGIQLDYERDIEAEVTIKCDNCPFDTKYKFDDSHVSKRGDWHLHKDEDGDQLHKEEIADCDHDMVVIKYISNDYDRAGIVVIRCRNCQLFGDLMADIPEGCSNRGRDKPQWFGSAEEYEIRRWLKVLRDDPDWDDIDWTEPPEKVDDWDEIEWNAESNPVRVSERYQLKQYISVEASLKKHMSGNRFSPISINFNVGNVFHRRHNKIMGVSQDLPKWNPRSIGFTE